MKTYKEMTGAVLARAKAEKMRQSKRRRSMALAVVCLCIAGMAAFTGTQVSDRTSADQEISVFCVKASAAEQKQEMCKGEKVPCHAVIRVRDVTGLTEVELAQLRAADKEYARQLAGAYPDEQLGGLDWSTTSRSSDRTMITTIYAGKFCICVDDLSQIRRISIETTKMGEAIQTTTDYYDPTLNDGIGITWSLSEFGLKMIEKNPTMDLSALKDTITIILELGDGSKQTVTIEITVDTQGQIYGTFLR